MRYKKSQTPNCCAGAVGTPLWRQLKHPRVTSMAREHTPTQGATVLSSVPSHHRRRASQRSRQQSFNAAMSPCPPSAAAERPSSRKSVPSTCDPLHHAPVSPQVSLRPPHLGEAACGGERTAQGRRPRVVDGTGQICGGIRACVAFVRWEGRGGVRCPWKEWDDWWRCLSARGGWLLGKN